MAVGRQGRGAHLRRRVRPGEQAPGGRPL